MLPTSATLDFKEERFKFSGKTQAPFSNYSLKPSTIRIPTSTTIAVFAPNLTPLLKKRFLLPQDFDNWLTENIKAQNGQYLLVLGQELDFAIIFKPQKTIDFSELSKIKTEEPKDSSSNSPYKQETENNLNFHLLKLPQETQETTFTFFEIGEWVFMTSSFQSAKQLVATQKGEAPFLNFLDFQKEPLSLAILIRNTTPQDSQALALFIKDDQKVKTQFEKIKEAQLIISDKELSGFIDFSKQ